MCLSFAIQNKNMTTLFINLVEITLAIICCVCPFVFHLAQAVSVVADMMAIHVLSNVCS
jgi:hypothetical protein